MTVISRPGDELVGGGKNAKYVKECKELFLGNKGIEKIRGFEDFINLETLWLNGNKLKKINNLDDNFRIKVLCVQDNQICTLKGSLLSFTFLEELDLSNNQLRDLDKLIVTLEKFKFLKNLNLQGNPCCEEPDYRMLVIHRIPSLKVLDQHVITPLERRKAAGLIGGDVQTLTVAFGKRVPQYDPAWDAKVPERSLLEHELNQEAEKLKDMKIVKAMDEELALFRHNPNPEIPRGRSLPPNAGMRKALETWQKAVNSPAPVSTPDTSQSGVDGGSRMITPNRDLTSQMPIGTTSAAQSFKTLTPFAAFATEPEVPVPSKEPSSKNPIVLSVVAERKRSAGRSRASSASPGRGTRPLGLLRKRSAGKKTLPPEPDVPSPYGTKDMLVLYKCKASPNNELLQSGTRVRSPMMFSSSGIRFEQRKYEEWVAVRAAGRGPWQLEKTTLRL